ncbi:hypothetical protein MMC14_007615 [Varicellaria rhodocarpa]|nr:hypothetical protein [Varicellaria rhodocarpa]
MPPFIPGRRRRSTPPSKAPSPKRAKKSSLFDLLDEPKSSASIQENKAFLNSLDDSESLSEVGSSEFEDALPSQSPSKRRKIVHDEQDEEEIDWEDAIQPEPSVVPARQSAEPSGDLELTLDKGLRIGFLTNPHDKKKGPSKIERQIRVSTHCMHVQFLLFHNLMRNAWTCDKQVQEILVGQLPEQMEKIIESWKRASGMAVETELKPPRSTQNNSRGIQRGGKGKGPESSRSQRDWGEPAERQELGVPDMSRGDPLLRLLKILTAYWKKRFRITAPALRKQGYKSLAVLEEELTSFQNEEHNPEEHGEKIDSLAIFRACARRSEGSRDVGVQLFTALIRGLGIEARLVASLQPVGFGWNKNEEAAPRKKQKPPKPAATLDIPTDDELSESGGNDVVIISSVSKSKRKVQTMAKSASRSEERRKHMSKLKGETGAPIDLSDDSELSSVSSSNDEGSDDDDSVIGVTPSVRDKKPNINYDRDMPFPTYWTEVESPITNKVYPVEPMMLVPAVASKPEHLYAFEPRGAKAEKAKMVFAYIIAYSSDGTAKEVTTRYLKHHMWPGKTKGARIPIEKIPLLNKRGKVKRYEEYDWFKTVISPYSKRDEMRTRVDDLEDAGDLKPVKPEKKEAKQGEQTLQGYKQSAEFVLKRHLRREEALLPGAEPVRTFVAGKGEKAKEEPVYRRKDVMICRTGESWHKEGRQVKLGETPMKMVPVRAVTLTRKREVEEAERDGGEKLKQGLYAWDQTDWIIPPPIKDGVIPKNAFGNMDAFVPTMIPKGAVHIPLRSTMKICKRLGIDFAEAVTGFEFGNKRAVPVITGVVVAVENEDVIIDAWEKDEEERKIKEEGKREKMALGMWRKFLMGLRIVERIREEYGDEEGAHLKEEMNPFTNKNKKPRNEPVHSTIENEDEMSGGFLPDIDDDTLEGGGFFPEGHDEEEVDNHRRGDFIVEDPSTTTPTPLSPTNGKPSPPPTSRTTSPPTTDLLEDALSRKRTKLPNQPSPSLPSSLSSSPSLKPSPKPAPNTKRKSKFQIDQPFQLSSSKREGGIPKRTAARRSETALKSHYFAEGVGDESEDKNEDESNTAANDDDESDENEDEGEGGKV